MRQVVTVLLFLFLINTAAQAQKGSVYVGGAVGFSNSKTKSELAGNTSEGPKNTTWSFSPEIGTFLTDQIQAGIGLTVAGSKGDNSQVIPGIMGKALVFGGSLYSRYFFGKEAFKPFAGVALSAVTGNQETTYGGSITSDNKVFGIEGNLNAGFGYALSRKVTALGSFGLISFSRNTVTDKLTDQKKTTTTFGIDAGTLGNRFSIGIYFTL